MESPPRRCHSLASRAQQKRRRNPAALDRYIALIPKTTRPILPRQLHPFGFTEISGRAVAGIMERRLLPYGQAYMAHLPQYAYLPDRSTNDAIRRAQFHCAEIFRTCRGRNSNALEKIRRYSYQNQPTAGIQISFDLSQALDRMERTFLAESMTDAVVPAELHAAMMQWMENVQFLAPYQGQIYEIAITRGCVREARFPLFYRFYLRGYL